MTTIRFDTPADSNEEPVGLIGKDSQGVPKEFPFGQALKKSVRFFTTLASAAATDNFTDDTPVWVAETSRWYRFVDNRTSTVEDGKDVVYVTSGGHLQALTFEPFRYAGTGYKEWKVNAHDLQDATPLHSSICWTSSSAAWASGIGVQDAITGIGGSNSDPNKTPDVEAGVPWGDDTAYPTGVADVATLIGGYDHRCNQLAGTVIGGGHNNLKYASSGHGTIVGGSNHLNAGGYGAVIGGTQNSIASGNYSFMGAGAFNVATGNYNGVLAGGENRVIGGGYSATVGGHQNRVTGSRSVAIGGNNNLVTHNNSVVMGEETVSDANGFLSFGSGKLVNVGDAQSFIGTVRGRTTGAAGLNLGAVDNALPTFPGDCTVYADLSMVGVDEANGDVTVMKMSVVMKAYNGTVTAFKDGAAGPTEPLFDVVMDQIGVSQTATCAVNTQALRPRTYGKTGSNIKWACTIKGTVVRI